MTYFEPNNKTLKQNSFILLSVWLGEPCRHWYFVIGDITTAKVKRVRADRMWNNFTCIPDMPVDLDVWTVAYQKFISTPFPDFRNGSKTRTYLASKSTADKKYGVGATDHLLDLGLLLTTDNYNEHFPDHRRDVDADVDADANMGEEGSGDSGDEYDEEPKKKKADRRTSKGRLIKAPIVYKPIHDQRKTALDTHSSRYSPIDSDYEFSSPRFLETKNTDSPVSKAYMVSVITETVRDAVKAAAPVAIVPVNPIDQLNQSLEVIKQYKVMGEQIREVLTVFSPPAVTSTTAPVNTGVLANRQQWEHEDKRRAEENKAKEEDRKAREKWEREKLEREERRREEDKKEREKWEREKLAREDARREEDKKEREKLEREKLEREERLRAEEKKAMEEERKERERKEQERLEREERRREEEKKELAHQALIQQQRDQHQAELQLLRDQLKQQSHPHPPSYLLRPTNYSGVDDFPYPYPSVDQSWCRPRGTSRGYHHEERREDYRSHEDRHGDEYYSRSQFYR